MKEPFKSFKSFKFVFEFQRYPPATKPAIINTINNPSFKVEFNFNSFIGLIERISFDEVEIFDKIFTLILLV